MLEQGLLDSSSLATLDRAIYFPPVSPPAIEGRLRIVSPASPLHLTLVLRGQVGSTGSPPRRPTGPTS